MPSISRTTRPGKRRLGRTGDLWWKDAVIYCIDVETFYDSNGDGMGDLDGITERIDYLAELGVTWTRGPVRVARARRRIHGRMEGLRFPLKPPRM